MVEQRQSAPPQSHAPSDASDPRSNRSTRISDEQRRQLGLVTAGLSLAAGLIHLVAAPEHLAEWWGYGYFFILAGVAQVLYAQLLFREPRRDRSFYALGLAGTLAIIVLYVISRTVGIPLLGPAAGEIEPVAPLDVLSKLVEVSLAITLAGELWRHRRGPANVEPGDQIARYRLFSRRRLLLSGGGLLITGLGVAAWRALAGAGLRRVGVPVWSRPTPPEGRSAPVSEAGPAREITLTAEEISWELAPGKQVRALAYNGQVPGPEIRIREGERLRVTLVNKLSTPTTIHWHGVDVPYPMDGVPNLPTPPVQPGQTFVYDFVAKPAGTRWYHTHVDSSRQLDRGLYGPLIVEPAEPEPNPPDREYTLVLSSWVTGQGRPVPDASDGGMGGGMMGGGMGGMMGGGMMGQSSGPAYDTFTVNGKAFPSTTPLSVRPGERVRLRLINASGERTHWIYLEGHRLRVTHTDGNPLAQPVEVDVVPIAPAERYDVEFDANSPGVWSLHDLAPGQTEAGLRVQVRYVGHEHDAEAPLRTDASGLVRWAYPRGKGDDHLGRATGRTRDYSLTLSGGMMGSTQWTINGQAYPNTDPLPVATGDLVHLYLFNMSMQAHPMHLHGHSFRLTAIGGRALPVPLIKDVVDVEPMESADLEFVADNPGIWMFHCHKPMHMDGGMITLVEYPGLPISSKDARAWSE